MHKKSLTLVEIIISIIIMALVLTGLANTFVAAKRHILHSRFRMGGGELGKYFLDPLQMQIRQDQWDPGPNQNCLAAGNCPSETWTIDNIPYQVTWNITGLPGSPTLRKVIASITWTEPQP